MRIRRRTFIQGAASAALAGGLAGCEKRDLRFAQGMFGAGEDSGAVEVSAADGADPITHVLNRLAYGPRPADYARVKAMGVQAFIEEQLDPESIDDSASEWRVRRFDAINAPVGELFEYKERFLLEQMTRATLLRAVYSRRQLHEQMVGFWTDHFNIDSSKGDCPWLKAADDREVIRRHAMGSFRDLVKASALSPAMLWYLDGRANRKANEEERANENYARELMELHTLGVHGGYTQRDVMEAARCLTGWTVREKGGYGLGRVEFISEMHDDGEKVVLGETIAAGKGEEDIDRLLELVTRHPSTARYISTKLCRRFIGEEPPGEAVDVVTEAFTDSEGDIRATLRALFATEAFGASSGAKFKRPFRYIVSALRVTGAETDAAEPLLDYLLRMGHSPFQYPTPDGYPEEAGPWMGTMLWRWHFARALAQNRVGGTKVDWKRLGERFGEKERLAAHLLGRRPNAIELETLIASDNGAALALASPAFQRC